MSQEIYPRKFYYCSCFDFFINEIFNSDVCKYSEILETILYRKMAPEHVFSARVEQNTSGIIVCSLHFEQFLVSETKYLCAAEDGFWFDELDRGYCYL